jgi:hypothetical protein
MPHPVNLLLTNKKKSFHTSHIKGVYPLCNYNTYIVDILYNQMNKCVYLFKCKIFHPTISNKGLKQNFWYYEYERDKFSPGFENQAEAIKDAEGFGYKVYVHIDDLFNVVRLSA